MYAYKSYKPSHFTYLNPSPDVVPGGEEEAPRAHQARPVRGLGAPGKGAPEAQRLVARARHDGLPVGGHGEVEHPMSFMDVCIGVAG